MKYMMMMNAPRGDGEYSVTRWAPEDLRAHIQFMQTLNKEIKASGEFVMAEGLAAPVAAKLVRAGEHGKIITDGPFAESKEFLAGFWILEVPSKERAIALAARVSMAPGKGGAPMHMPVELREVMFASDLS